MKKHGFTLPELVIVLGVLVVLFSLSSVNLINFYHKNSLGVSVNSIVSDIKQQQIKAMVGDTEGRAPNNAYGIYFQSDNYTLFQGTAYSPSDSYNFTINLEDDIGFSNIMFTGQLLVFATSSGEVVGYTANFDYVTVQNIRSGETKTIRFNKYGTITNIY